VRVAVIGAGVGGLATAVRLAAAGHAVTVLEAAAAPGGKCGRVARDGYVWDSGPSLLTMPWVFEALFAETGAPLADELELLPVEPVTRYRFADGSGFDLSADAERSRAALDAWRPGAGAEWDRFLATCAAMWRASKAVLAGPAPWPPQLQRGGPSPLDLVRVKPWWTLRQLACAHTSDPRLQMVIERFATYAGADPRRAPAALAVAGYVEHAWGAWHPRGGIYTLVEALVRRLAALGGELRLSTRARRIVLRPDEGGSPLRRLGPRHRGGGLIGRPLRAAGVETDGGFLPADAMVAAIDADAVHRDLLRRPLPPRERSLSGLALMLGLRGRTPGLVHHSITFPAGYDAEFDDVFVHRRPVRDPTVYVSASCATDPGETPENWFVLVNAPAVAADWEREAERLIDRLGVRDRIAARALRTPCELGPIYGIAPHGRLGTLRRPPPIVRGIRRLRLAGGTVHPGGGLPLVVLGAATAARAIGPAR
jgi:phytoene desaturase